MGPFLFFLALAVVLLIVELAVFQFSVFWFLFIALGSAAAALWSLVVPEAGWAAAIAVATVGSLGAAAAGWPLLRRLQERGDTQPGNDVIGQSVEVISAIAPGVAGEVKWSGATWRARLGPGAAAPIAAGQRATIVSLSAIELVVEAS